jgi:hypothetical protein
VWNGAHVYLTSTGPRQQSTSYSSLTFGADVETAWVKPADLQGRFSIRQMTLLGEYRSAHLVRCRIYTNYRDTPVYDRVWTATGDVGGPLQVKFGRHFDNVESFKVRFTAMGTDSARASLDMSVGGNWTAGSTVATSGTAWAGVLEAIDPGTDGNGLAFAVYTTQGPLGCETRDNEEYDGSNWAANDGFVGVRAGDSSTVSQLEAAIAGSRLVRVKTADASPTKVISDTNTLHESTTFSGGTTTLPTGEAAKLTGIAVEIGIKPGVHNRLPTSQRI